MFAGNIGAAQSFDTILSAAENFISTLRLNGLLWVMGAAQNGSTSKLKSVGYKIVFI